MMGCGLVMNEDDIQHGAPKHLQSNGCGLVMNEDDIQQTLNSPAP